MAGGWYVATSAAKESRPWGSRSSDFSSSRRSRYRSIPWRRLEVLPACLLACLPTWAFPNILSIVEYSILEPVGPVRGRFVAGSWPVGTLE